MSDEKTRENRSRRAAKRRGWELVKAGAMDGMRVWALVEVESRRIVSGLLLLTLDEVETLLSPPTQNDTQHDEGDVG